MEDSDYVTYTNIHDRLCRLACSVNGVIYPGVTMKTTFKELGIHDLVDSVTLLVKIKEEFNYSYSMRLLRPDSNVVRCVLDIFLESI